MGKRKVKKTKQPVEGLEALDVTENASGKPPTGDGKEQPKQQDKTEEKHDILGKNLVTQFLYVLGLEDMRIHRWKLIWLNFMLGLARGLGFFLGAVVIGGLLLAILNKFIDAPVIGDFISQIIDAIKGTKQ